MNEKVNEFKAKNIQTHPCGQKSFWDNFKKKTYIKDLDGKILYEGRGNFQRVLENAVKEGIELPKADLRNQKFIAVQIPKAKLRGASFEGSSIERFTKHIQHRGYGENVLRFSDLSDSDLREVSFKKTTIADETNFKDSDVAKADFDNHQFARYNKSKSLVFPAHSNFEYLKNFDQADNVNEDDLNYWRTKQPAIEKARKEAQAKVMSDKQIGFEKIKEQILFKQI